MFKCTVSKENRVARLVSEVEEMRMVNEWTNNNFSGFLAKLGKFIFRVFNIAVLLFRGIRQIATNEWNIDSMQSCWNIKNQ